jgi:hypothetical protein
MFLASLVVLTVVVIAVVSFFSRLRRQAKRAAPNVASRSRPEVPGTRVIWDASDRSWLLSLRAHNLVSPGSLGVLGALALAFLSAQALLLGFGRGGTNEDPRATGGLGGSLSHDESHLLASDDCTHHDQTGSHTDLTYGDRHADGAPHSDSCR